MRSIVTNVKLGGGRARLGGGRARLGGGRARLGLLLGLVCLVGCSAAEPSQPSSAAGPAGPLATAIPVAVGATNPADSIVTPVTSDAPGGSTTPVTPVVAKPTPTSTPTSTPAPIESPPATQTPDPGDSGSQTPAGMSKEVLGFFLPSQMDYVLNTTDFRVLSSIAFFGITAGKNGGLHKATKGGGTDWRWNAWMGSKMDRIIAKAHAAGTKVIFTVTRFSWTSHTYDTSVKMLSKAANRQRLAEETAKAVTDRHADGVNVDFEPIPSSQKHNFVDFVRRLRSELNARKHGLELTVDTTGYIANYDVAGLTAPGAADAIYIMAYHYSGTWSQHAAAVSPLHRSSYDVTDTVNAFLKYTTPDKLMLGLAYYGNTWPTETGSLMSKTKPGSSRVGYPGSVIYSHAVGLANAHGRLWDDIEKVPWTRWQSRECGSCPLTWHQLYYEDAQSLKLKHDLVINRGLRGTGIWTLGFGGGGPELNNELKGSFGSH